MADAQLAPSPDASPENRPFWEGLASGKLLIRQCGACGKAHWYPRAHCPLCLAAEETRWVEARGKGVIYSFSVMRRAATPYVVAFVTLGEGPTLMTNIITDEPDAVRIGDGVRVVFQSAPGLSAPFAFVRLDED